MLLYKGLSRVCKEQEVFGFMFTHHELLRDLPDKSRYVSLVVSFVKGKRQKTASRFSQGLSQGVLNPSLSSNKQAQCQPT
jgi:hypothetical protein